MLRGYHIRTVMIVSGKGYVAKNRFQLPASGLPVCVWRHPGAGEWAGIGFFWYD